VKREHHCRAAYRNRTDDLRITRGTVPGRARASCTDSTAIALMAPAALGLSGYPVHEPVHAEAPASGQHATVRNFSESAGSASTTSPAVAGPTVFKSVRDLLSATATASTWPSSMSASCLIQDHPAYIPRPGCYCHRRCQARPGKGRPAVTRLCAWCENPIPASARRDAVCCSVRCRRARHRFLRAVGHADAIAAGRLLRLAYADPPYPGKARLYRDHPEYGGESTTPGSSSSPADFWRVGRDLRPCLPGLCSGMLAACSWPVRRQPGSNIVKEPGRMSTAGCSASQAVSTPGRCRHDLRICRCCAVASGR
jgi:hypothetical protein